MVQAPVKQEDVKQESPEPMDLDNAALIEQLAKDPAKLTQPIKVAAGVEWGMLLIGRQLLPVSLHSSGRPGFWASMGLFRKSFCPAYSPRWCRVPGLAGHAEPVQLPSTLTDEALAVHTRRHPLADL